MVIVKGMVVLAGAWLLTLVLRRASAALRHLIWSLAVFAVFVLPALSLALPAWPLPFTAPWAESPVVRSAPARPRAVMVAQALDLPSSTPDPRDALPEGLEDGSPSVAASEPPAEPTPLILGSVWSALVLVWLVGAVLASVPVVLGGWSLHCLRRRACVMDTGLPARLLRQLCVQMGMRRPVALLQSAARSIPMTWGLRRPIVLLPAGAEDWPEPRLRMVLLHELAHVKRWDCATQVVAQLFRALYWFNPLAWLAVAGMRTEQERACDDLVLSAGTDAPDYAELLLTITAGRARHWLDSSVALVLGEASRIERRLASILDRQRNRRPLTVRTVAMATLATAGLLLPLSAVGLRAAVMAMPAPEADPLAAPLDGPAKKMLEVHSMILARSIRPVDDTAVGEAAIRGMLDALGDPYAAYLTPQSLHLFIPQVRGSITGIGVNVFDSMDKRPVITSLLEGSPALKAGLRAGDVILAIDGQPVQGTVASGALRGIMGPPGSVVKLKVAHTDGREEELAVTRDRVRIRTVQGFQRDADGRWEYLFERSHKIGYVAVLQFTPHTVGELRSALEPLRGAGLRGLILDLRFCPGGVIASAVEMVKLFLSRGTILAVKGPGGQQQTWEADGKNTLGDFPLVVLVGQHTASSAEVVAGALQENGRAVVVGSRTYGKASMQEILKLGDGGALKLTTAYYHLPSGRNIHKRPGEKTWGIDPDNGYYIPMDSTQWQAMVKVALKREVLGGDKPSLREDHITPQILLERHADPQLAGALKTLIARLDSGAFVKVGQSARKLADDMTRRQELENQRAELLKQLEEVNKKLGISGGNPASMSADKVP
jgi:carboxyl-terminal processing protease